MIPIHFKESNRVLKGNPDGVEPLRIWTDGDVCISKWKISWKERFKILFGNPVYLGIKSGETQPPVWIELTGLEVVSHD